MCERLSFGSICNARRKVSAPSLYLNCSSNATPMLLARYASSREAVVGWFCNLADDVPARKSAGEHTAKTKRQKITGLRFFITPVPTLYRIGAQQHCIEFEDRKSTRLNSSHVEISYAV